MPGTLNGGPLQATSHLCFSNFLTIDSPAVHLLSVELVAIGPVEILDPFEIANMVADPVQLPYVDHDLNATLQNLLNVVGTVDKSITRVLESLTDIPINLVKVFEFAHHGHAEDLANVGSVEIAGNVLCDGIAQVILHA